MRGAGGRAGGRHAGELDWGVRPEECVWPWPQRQQGEPNNASRPPCITHLAPALRPTLHLPRGLLPDVSAPCALPAPPRPAQATCGTRAAWWSRSRSRRAARSSSRSPGRRRPSRRSPRSRSVRDRGRRGRGRSGTDGGRAREAGALFAAVRRGEHGRPAGPGRSPPPSAPRPLPPPTYVAARRDPRELRLPKFLACSCSSTFCRSLFCSQLECHPNSALTGPRPPAQRARTAAGAGPRALQPRPPPRSPVVPCLLP